MDKPDQTVWGKLAWGGYAYWMHYPHTCRFLLEPNTNSGDLEYSAEFLASPYFFYTARDYHGAFVFEGSKAVARFNLNGREGMKLTGEIFEAKLKLNDGKWYMDLPHRAMPLVASTMYFADPIKGIRKGLLTPPEIPDPVSGTVFPYGVLLKPFDNPADTSRFSYWKIDEEEGWVYDGTYRWQITDDTTKYVRDGLGQRFYRTSRAYIPDTNIFTATFEIFTVDPEDGSLIRTVEVVPPVSVILHTTVGCDGAVTQESTIVSQAGLPFSKGGRTWTQMVTPSGSTSFFIRDDGYIFTGSSISDFYLAFDHSIGGNLIKYTYEPTPPSSWTAECGDPPNITYQTVTVTYNTLVRVVESELDFSEYLGDSPSYRVLNSGSDWDFWVMPDDYIILQAGAWTFHTGQHGGWSFTTLGDIFICIRKSDFEINVINWSDYEQEYGVTKPESCRFYGGVPYLHCMRDPDPRILINMLDGVVSVPREENYLWGEYDPVGYWVGNKLAYTTYDGIYGYDAEFFYEEAPEHEPYLTYHGDTVVAFMLDTIHVTACEVEEIDDCDPGEYRAKATFTISDLNTGEPVEGVDVTISMITYKNDVPFGIGVAELETTDENGQVTFEYPNCVACDEEDVLEIRFTVQDVHSYDVRNYDPRANLCSEAIFSTDDDVGEPLCCDATFTPDPAQFATFYPFQGQVANKWWHIMVATQPTIDPSGCTSFLEYMFECEDDEALNSPWRDALVSGTFPDGRSQVGRPHEYWAEVPSNGAPYSAYKWRVRYRMKNCPDGSAPSGWTSLQ